MNKKKSSSTHPSSLYFTARVKPVQDGFVQLLLDRADLDLVNHLFGEAVRQQVARHVRVQAATGEIEKLLLFELPDGCAVGALHVVRENLQLRLGVNARFVREQQVLVRLHRIRLLRALPDKDFSIKDG